MPLTIPMFALRDYDKRDFELLFKLDRLCFDPGIAYSRPELASFIEQRRAYTVVAEWADLAPEASSTERVGDEAELNPPALIEPALIQPAAELTEPVFRNGKKPRPPRRPIAGFVTFHYQRQGYGHIITIDVHPDARRHRLGTQLIAAACERLRKMTAFMVVLEVAVNNHSALAFYDQHGFKRIKVLERYYNRSVDAIFMTKRL
jgi:[ribosomal protein S18]-alanine N-acetyltransferase